MHKPERDHVDKKLERLHKPSFENVFTYKDDDDAVRAPHKHIQQLHNVCTVCSNVSRQRGELHAIHLNNYHLVLSIG